MACNEQQVTLAGWREVWTATHGRASRYHVSLDGLAACRPQNTRNFRATIPLCRLVDASDVEPHMRCQRNGCKQRWP